MDSLFQMRVGRNAIDALKEPFGTIYEVGPTSLRLCMLNVQFPMM